LLGLHTYWLLLVNPFRCRRTVVFVGPALLVAASGLG
jgi:hypothetical protein